MVLMAPTKKRKPRRSWGMSSEPMTAAWPAPSPGMKEAKGAAMIVASVALRNSFLVNLIRLRGWCFCLGSLGWFLRETTNAEAPKRPVRRGRRGSLTGRLNVRSPRKPARKKTARPVVRCCSRKMR